LIKREAPECFYITGYARGLDNYSAAGVCCLGFPIPGNNWLGPL
jgi:hypothetical protein